MTTTIIYCSLLYIFRYERLWNTCKIILFLQSLCLGTIDRCITDEMNILEHGLHFDIKNVFIYWQSTTKPCAKSMLMGLLMCFGDMFKTNTTTGHWQINKYVPVLVVFSSSNYYYWSDATKLWYFNFNFII